MESLCQQGRAVASSPAQRGRIEEGGLFQASRTWIFLGSAGARWMCSEPEASYATTLCRIRHSMGRTSLSKPRFISDLRRKGRGLMEHFGTESIEEVCLGDRKRLYPASEWSPTFRLPSLQLCRRDAYTTRRIALTGILK
jgi:hypothetical protein